MRHIPWLLLLLIAAVPASPIIGQIEGRVFPVAGPAVVEEIDRFEDGWTYFSMSAPKRRDCNWRSTKFYLGDRSNGNVPVAFEHLDRPQVRGPGRQYWPSSRIQLSPDQLLNNAHADVAHTCGWGLWLTVTPFYN